MNANDFIQLGLYMVVLLLLVKPLGSYMAVVFSDSPNRVTRDWRSHRAPAVPHLRALRQTKR